MHIFISYSSKDATEAFKACDVLEKNGKKCFIAPRDILPGKEYAEEIVNGIDTAEAVVLLLSSNANQSPHVLREVERAVSKSIPIFVCKLEEVELSKSMEYFLMTHQWVDIKPQGDYTKILNLVNQVTELKENISGTDVESTVLQQTQKKNRYITLIIGIILLLGVGILIGVVATQQGRYATTENDGNEKNIEVGDTITFGTYNDEPIQWRVLKIKEDGTAVLISKHILTMKAFDAAEGGTYNQDGTSEYWGQDTAADIDMELQVFVRGNSDWSRSNIRTWLNSTDEVVIYEDYPPRTTAMSEGKNGYHNEPGFLYYFTEEEHRAIVETEIVTNTNVLQEEDTIITKDKVYLLSVDELDWFTDAGISQLAVPTQEAEKQDQSRWYVLDKDAYGVEEYCWWLREPVKNMASQCYLVGNGYREENILKGNVGLEGYGIRPAITVDLTAACFQ